MQAINAADEVSFAWGWVSIIARIVMDPVSFIAVADDCVTASAGDSSTTPDRGCEIRGVQENLSLNFNE
jgi:hypothetical protein